MIDTIFFDFVGVLLFPKEYDDTNPLIDEIDNQIGTVTNDTVFKEQIIHKYNLLESEFNAVLESIVNKYVPYIPLLRLLSELRKCYKLGIINNGTYLTYPLFEAKYHLSQQFDVFLSSAVVGVCKPERAIYLHACKKIKSQPRTCLFMDDSEENIMGAQMVGMQTIHWLDKESGFQEFKAWLGALRRMQTGERSFE